MADADLSDVAASLDPRNRRQLIVRRIVQFTVDLSITTLLCLIPLFAMWLLVPRAPDGTVRVLAGFLAFCLVSALVLLIAVSYWVWLPGRQRIDHLGGGGQTPAMRWFRLRIVDQSGVAATRVQLAVRWIMLLVDGMAFGLVGLVTMVVSPNGQRVGDLLAGTVVRTERHRRPVSESRRARAELRIERPARSAESQNS